MAEATSPIPVGVYPYLTVKGAKAALEVDDADAWWKRAVDAGAETRMPLGDQFWGDRYGQLKDPFGRSWSIGMAIGK